MKCELSNWKLIVDYLRVHLRVYGYNLLYYNSLALTVVRIRYCRQRVIILVAALHR